jgi:NTP pyrophosphatase (non-canonical NTP hydrolase)
MNKINRSKLYRLARAKWGEQSQLMVFIEECSELIQSISKYNRYRKTSAQPSRDLAEEIADVEIMIEQLELMHDWENFRIKINTAKHDKLLRLKEIVDKNNVVKV